MLEKEKLQTIWWTLSAPWTERWHSEIEEKLDPPLWAKFFDMSHESGTAYQIIGDIATAAELQLGKTTIRR